MFTLGGFEKRDTGFVLVKSPLIDVFSDCLVGFGKSGADDVLEKRPTVGLASIYFCSLGGFGKKDEEVAPENSPVAGFVSAYL